ncbi:MAG: SpoIID/LytB domain-containing protein [Nitriliruptoraceae bacterium]
MPENPSVFPPRWATGVVLLAAMLVTAPPPSLAAATPQGSLVEGPVHFRAADGDLLEVAGTRYHDTIEVTAEGRVVNELDLERYVEGVAEMPSRWPVEALKAQAVAARTYVWWSAEHSSQPEADICASTACQVFRGAEPVLDGGERWAEAVASTAGEVLLEDDGGPILARYFSTSGGRTSANEDIFPETGPRDYLVAIEDPFDAASPYHRWEVPFSRAEFEDVLSRGERLAAAVPVAEVTRTGAVDDPGAGFVVVGQDGTEVSVGAVELRDLLNQVAPSRFPDRFPTRRSDRLRPLPTTVPSSRFTVTVEGNEVLLAGRGWGHGVGMGQYGARGRAADGADHTAILAAYYGGLVPTVSEELPERVRVALGRLGDGEERRVAGDGPVQIIDRDGEVIVERAIGGWSVRRTDGQWELRPPPGTDRQLEVTPTREVATLSRAGDAVTVETEVNKPTLLELEVTAEDGTQVFTRSLGVAEPGVHAATWRYETDAGESVPTGTYEVVLVAEDALGERAGSPLAVEISSADPQGTVDGGDADATRRSTPGILLTAGAVLSVALLLLVVFLARLDRRSST